MNNQINIKNKRAEHFFEISETFTAGIILTGTEIKSIRQGKVSIVDAYCFFKDGDLWIKGMQIAEYEYGTYNNHDPKRDKKLLLNKTELKKLERKTKEKGYTIVALKLFLNDKGLAKLDIALARGKSMHDKREDIRSKDAKRDMDRYMKK
ncbi:MAG: SsrA-binding protein SmpB [Bacteroidia bacterium]|nr:SsrA-binding protein SmpB [Bacteroidia bacterium]